MQWTRGDLAARAVYALALAGWALSIAFPVEARHVFYLTCGLASLAWLFERRVPSREVRNLLIVLALYAFYRYGHTIIDAGTLSLKNNSEQVSVAIAQRFLMSIFLIGYLSTRKEIWSASWTLYSLGAALAIGLCYAGYIDYVLAQDRGSREQRATVLSYEIVALYLVFLGVLLEQHIYRGWRSRFLLAGATITALILILWTQTRSALLGFLLGGVLLVMRSERSEKWRILGFGILLSIMLMVVSYSDTIRPRLIEAQTDVTQYISGENRATSLGIRFELWQAGWMAFKGSPWFGGGYERRAALIDKAIAEGRLDPILHHYKKISIHNEILEELSMRGLVGGGLLVSMYGYLFFLALRRKTQSLPLLGLVFAFAFFGLTDVLFFSREATVVFLLSLALLIPRPFRDAKS